VTNRNVNPQTAEAFDPPPEQRSGFHSGGINATGGRSERFDSQFRRPFPDRLRAEILEYRFPEQSGLLVARVARSKCREILGVCEV
jgi:hypothetical protein